MRPLAYASTLEVISWMGSGIALVSAFACSRSSRSGLFACSRPNAEDSAPTGSWFLLLYCVGSDTCWLSFRMITMFLSKYPALFIASYAMPPVMAPSPMMATTWLSPPLRSRPTAMPSPAEMLVLECPAPKQSYSDSDRLVKGDRPPVWRMVGMPLRRPVKILWGYAWCPTSQMNLSSGQLYT